jgi:two-component system chemotaxis response regulator CheY
MKTCLIVDDSSIIRKVARRILESLEFQILEAENGEQANRRIQAGIFASSSDGSRST